MDTGSPAKSPQFLRPTWCEIDLSAVAHNTKQLKEIIGPGVLLLVCLKGDALGCGAEQVSMACERAGADGFSFGSIDAAIACRKAGATLPMLLYPNCLPETAEVLEKYRLSPTISTLDEVQRWADKVTSTLDVFLKIDSGGLRAGAFPQDALEIAQAIASKPNLRLAGVYGHSLASYDNENAIGPWQLQRTQLESFLDAVQRIEKAGIDIPIRMYSSSETVLSHPQADLNAVEPGRLILGIEFPAVSSRLRKWQPAMVGLKSRLVVKKFLHNDSDIKRTHLFNVRDDMVIGLIPIGWSDGYPRKLPIGATALIRGKRVSLLGPVHSELLRIDLTDVADATVGDEVVLMGRSGNEQISLLDLTQQWNVGLTDVFSAIGKTLPRRFFFEQKRPGMSLATQP